MKFGHLAIAQNGSRRVSGKKGLWEIKVKGVDKIKIKGVDKEIAAISPYRRRFQKFKKGFGALLIQFTYFVYPIRSHRILIKRRFQES